MTGCRITAQRGYGGARQALRRRVAETVDAGRAWCRRCGKWIPPGTRWCLGHTDDRRGSMGPEHAYCSTVSGGRISGGRRAVVLDDEDLSPKVTSRRW